jgi:hypothetical protein
MLSSPAVAYAVGEVDWRDTAPSSGVVVEDEVQVNGTGTHRLVTIVDPDISDDEYAITGRLRYEDVGGDGYLEMWSFFADGSAYFSRTLGRTGPTAVMRGASSGREFLLPFSLNGAAGPERVEVNVVLPAGGTVWIGPLALQGFGESQTWWTEPQAGIVGATLGVIAGLLGAAIGLLDRSGRHPRALKFLLIGGTVGGVIALLVGGVAFLAGQPRHVPYPLLLTGLIVTVVSAALLSQLRRRSASAELRRMRALDA